MTISIRDVAKTAGVSVCTVSKALRGEPGVADSTREHTRKVAQELGYVPNMNASFLRTGKRSLLSVIYALHRYETINLRNYFLFELARDIYKDTRFQMRVIGDEPLDKAVNKAIYNNSTAIILHQQMGDIKEETLRRIENQGIAVTCLDCRVSDNFDSVTIEREVGTFQAIRLLLLNKCKNIVVYSVTTFDKPDGRLRGIMKGYKSLNRDYTEARLYNTQQDSSDNSYGRGYEIGKNLIRTSKFDGIFCFSDQLAVGTMRALREAHIDVPDEVKIIGFDNFEVTEYLPVSLTTVELPMSGICKIALRMNKERLADSKAPVQHVSVPTRLIVRDSCPFLNNKQRGEVFVGAVEVA